MSTESDKYGEPGTVFVMFAAIILFGLLLILTGA